MAKVKIYEFNGSGELIYVDEVKPDFDSVEEAEEWVEAYKQHLTDACVDEFYELEVYDNEPH